MAARHNQDSDRHHPVDVANTESTGVTLRARNLHDGTVPHNRCKIIALRNARRLLVAAWRMISQSPSPRFTPSPPSPPGPPPSPTQRFRAYPKRCMRQSGAYMASVLNRCGSCWMWIVSKQLCAGASELICSLTPFLAHQQGHVLLPPRSVNMGFGVLEPRFGYGAPGTVLLDQSAAHSDDQTGHLKHGTGKNAHIVLAPQPSEDPNDPFVFCVTHLNQARADLAEPDSTGRNGRES